MILYWIIIAIIYVPVKLFFPTKVLNKRSFPKDKKIILISNHLSWFDIVILSVNLRGYRHIFAKKELTKNPFARVMGKALGVIFVDRGKADIQAIRSVMSVLKKGRGLTIFPEGTRNKNGEKLQELKNGVVLFSVRGNAPIVPVIIYKKSKIFKKNYIFVGDKFVLNEDGDAINSEIIKDKIKIVEQSMQKTQEMLYDYLEKKSTKKKIKSIEKRSEV